MCASELVQSSFEDERVALTARMQFCDDSCTRYALFDALVSLEARALMARAPDVTLRKIAEVRFLVGILREAVRTSPVMSLRSLMRTCRPGGARRHAAVNAMREA